MGRALRVHVVCQNLRQDRVIPRMARALGKALGWTASARGAPSDTDVVYLSAYFEARRMKPWPAAPVAAYFTHREEQPPGNHKAQVFDGVARQVQLRVATCGKYAKALRKVGPTLQASAPLDRELFCVQGRSQGKRHQGRPVVGLSGYTYPNRRKGEDLVRAMLKAPIAGRVEWRASGRGWPVPTVRYQWQEMGSFYRGLDVLVCPSRVEGIPMPPLEALACGVRVVIPRGVGLLDELMQIEGVHRYKRGDAQAMIAALEKAAFPKRKADREALAAVVAPYSVEAWCEDHRRGFAEVFG